ncbi:MAG: AI-2E family transporter [Flavobacteriales bacterium]|nr:AI-2E family transporter [Flavobacteriales bacterium]
MNHRLANIFYGLGSIIMLGFLLIIGQHIIAPIIISGFVAIALLPIYSRLLKHLKSQLITGLLLIIGLSLVFLGIAGMASWQFAQIYKDHSGFAEKLQSIPAQYNFDEYIAVDKESLVGMVNSGSAYILNGFQSISEVASGLLLSPIYIFFFLFYRKKFMKLAIHVMGLLSFETVEPLNKVSDVISNHLKGMLIVTSVMGIALSAGLYFLGVPYAIFLGFFSAVCAIIPYIGILIGGIPVLLISYLTQESLTTLALIMGWYALIQVLEGNILTPKIVGNEVNINPFAAIISLLIGGAAWGIIGMIIAIPTIAIIQIFLKQANTGSRFAKVLSN